VKATSLEGILARQRRFNERFFSDLGYEIARLSPAERVAWSKDFVLHLEGELHELLGETSWKMHHRRTTPVVRGNVLEEWVDCLKFLLGLANVWGFSPGEILEEFERKSEVVEYRYAMEARLRALSPEDPVVAVDLDGVLNDYPRCFLDWARLDVEDWEVPGEFVFSSTAALRRELGALGYQNLKDRYRESGAKREQGVREGARELLDGLRAAGLTAVVLSARPYWRVSRIYADTLEWLNRSALRADAVLFDREKHRRILRDFPGTVAVVEDDPAVAREVLAAGVPVVLVEGEANAGVELVGAVRVPGPREALAVVLELAEGRKKR